MVKVFLSSTMDDLIEARHGFKDKFSESTSDIELVDYDSHKKLYPTLTPEETCLQLVAGCEVILVLLDRYYGENSKIDPKISMTHAEIRKGIVLGLKIVPVIRLRTWHEYLVWTKNKEKQITFGHVIQPRLFEIIEELKCLNFHIFDIFTKKEKLEEIAQILKSVVLENGIGRVDSVTIELDESDQGLLQRKIFPIFFDGAVLRSDDLNALYGFIIETAHNNGLKSISGRTWINGTTLHAKDLNVMLSDVNKIYAHINKPLPNWSFGEFKSGQPLRASQLNEIVQNVKNLQ